MPMPASPSRAVKLSWSPGEAMKTNQIKILLLFRRGSGVRQVEGIGGHVVC